MLQLTGGLRVAQARKLEKALAQLELKPLVSRRHDTVPRPMKVATFAEAFVRVGCALGLALGPVACGAAQAEDPGSVLRSYARALEESRADDAYKLLSSEARRGVSPEAFRRMVTENPDDARELGKSLQRTAAPAVVTATVSGPQGQELVLVMQDGRWRIDSAAIDLYGQDTPRRAIQGFLRALERHRYDVVLKYVPDNHREGLDAKKLKEWAEGAEKQEVAAFVGAVRQSLPTAAIEETGDRASMTYGGGTLQLVRERGAWKIEDFD